MVYRAGLFFVSAQSRLLTFLQYICNDFLTVTGTNETA